MGSRRYCLQCTGDAVVGPGDRLLHPGQEDLLLWAGFPRSMLLFHVSRLYILIVF